MRIRHLIKRIFKSKKGSQLVEEGLLIAISLVALTVILSMVSGFLATVQGTFVNTQGTLDEFLVQVLGEDLDKIWNSTIGKITGG